MEVFLETGASESWRIINEYGFYLDICHYSLALMSAKKRLGSTAREKPLISVGVSLFSCFLSGFTLNFLCGLPILSSLQVTETLLMIACLWTLMNFIIPDMWDRILANPAVLVLLTAGKELLRNKKIYGSIDKALKIYPDSVHIVAALGLVGCTAGGAVTHYLTAVQNKSFSGNQKPALATKFSFIFAILHTCATMKIPVFGWLATREELCFLYFLLAAPILITEKFGLTLDPFQPAQDALYDVLVTLEHKNSTKSPSKKIQKAKNE